MAGSARYTAVLDANVLYPALLRDPNEVVDAFGIELQTPDEFVLNQIMLRGAVALSAIKAMRERWGRPQVTAMALVDLLEKRGLPQTAAHLRDVVLLI